MKTYSVLFAEDVPHYGTAHLEAEDDAAALEAAKAYDISEIANDPEWENSVCRRIVHIEDAAGNTIFHDIPLDNYCLCLASERTDMLNALKLCEDVLSDLARLDDGTASISALNLVRAVLAETKGTKI
jgi:hypothetical protein